MTFNTEDPPEVAVHSLRLRGSLVKAKSDNSTENQVSQDNLRWESYSGTKEHLEFI